MQQIPYECMELDLKLGTMSRASLLVEFIKGLSLLGRT